MHYFTPWLSDLSFVSFVYVLLNKRSLKQMCILISELSVYVVAVLWNQSPGYMWKHGAQLCTVMCSLIESCTLSLSVSVEQ